MTTLRKLEWHAPTFGLDSEEMDANVATIEVKGELFVQIELMGGPTDQPPAEPQIIRLSERAVRTIADFRMHFEKQSN